ncbi:MAG: AEC family transporter [Pseudomonadota bacterium]
MAQIVGLIAPLFGVILLGYVTARLKPEPIEALGWLNIFIVYLALPALFIKIMAETPVEDLANGRFILGVLLASTVILALGFILGLLVTRGSIPEATIQALASAYGNIGYMGPAVAILAFGEAAAAPVALIVCFENILYFTFAPAMMAIAGRSEAGAGGPARGAAWLSAVRLAGQVAAKVLLHPFILAAAIGVALAVAEASLPEPLERLIDTLAQAAAPCALFAMGVTLALRPLRRAPAALGFIAPLKLIIHPILMYWTLVWIAGDAPFEPIWLATAVLLASLPSATNVYVIASQYGVWLERASASVLATTGFSLVTVSAALWWLTKSGSF